MAITDYLLDREDTPVIEARTTAIIPCLNVSPTIRNIVEAMVAHSLIYEIIVVLDKETTDDTAEQAMPHDPIVQIGFSEQHGKGQIVTEALSVVRTPYVFFCDGDITGLTHDHISLLLADTLLEERSMTIGVPDIPSNYPTERIWAWPWVSGQRVMPYAVVKPLRLHGYLMETQLNAAAKNADIRVRMEWLRGCKSVYNMTEQRLSDMESDARWGREHGILL